MFILNIFSRCCYLEIDLAKCQLKSQQVSAAKKRQTAKRKQESEREKALLVTYDTC